MPSQDLLFPILPRAPATPNPDDIKREVTQISKKHQLHKTNTDNSDSQQRQHAYGQKRQDQAHADDADHKPDPEHQIDLFV